MGRKLILVLFLSFFAMGSFAAVPENLDLQKWNDLVKQIQLTGKSSEYPNASYLSVSHVVPNDMTQERVANFMSTVGYYDADGNYIPMRIEGVSEVWKIDQNGNWDVDQWLFLAGLNADLARAEHRHIVKTVEGIILKVETVPSSESEKLQAWDKSLQEWFKLLPLSL